MKKLRFIKLMFVQLRGRKVIRNDMCKKIERNKINLLGMDKIFFGFTILFICTTLSRGCKDLTEKCKTYELRKNYYCKHDWTRTNCPKMCRICDGISPTKNPSVKPDPDCQDKSTSCSYYRSIGFCDKSHYNHIWASVNCKRSCDLCGTTTGTNPTAPPTKVTPTRGTTIQKPVTKIPQGGCGIPSMTGRVISGETSKRGQWPWIVALFRDGRFSCGASIIHPRWILTAAHCVYGYSSKQFHVVAGESDIYNKEEGEQIFKVDDAIWHSDYGRPTTLNNDIALIKLNKPIIFNSRIKTICLPPPGVNPKIGDKCVVSGWGKMTHPGNSAQFLQHAQLAILSHDVCKERNNKWTPITRQMICAGNPWPNVQASCHGDSGGPLVCQQPGGHWVIHGTVSWGSPRCYIADAFSVFARVSQFRDWIENTVQKYSD